MAPTRRGLLGGAVAVPAAAALAGPLTEAAPAAAGPASPTPAPVAAGELELALTVNGQARTLSLDTRVTLLAALRGRLGLTGTKKGCGRGQCVACTVHVGGRGVLA